MIITELGTEPATTPKAPSMTPPNPARFIVTIASCAQWPLARATIEGRIENATRITKATTAPPFNLETAV
jgi:hypothetical protein